RAVASTVGEAGTGEILRQAAHQPDRSRGTERGQIVVVDAIAESRVADLVQANELIESECPAVRHHEAMEGDCQSLLPLRLNRPGFTKDARTSRNDNYP